MGIQNLNFFEISMIIISISTVLLIGIILFNKYDLLWERSNDQDSIIQNMQKQINELKQNSTKHEIRISDLLQSTKKHEYEILNYYEYLKKFQTLVQLNKDKLVTHKKALRTISKSLSIMDEFTRGLEETADSTNGNFIIDRLSLIMNRVEQMQKVHTMIESIQLSTQLQSAQSQNEQTIEIAMIQYDLLQATESIKQIHQFEDLGFYNVIILSIIGDLNSIDITSEIHFEYKEQDNAIHSDDCSNNTKACLEWVSINGKYSWYLKEEIQEDISNSDLQKPLSVITPPELQNDDVQELIDSIDFPEFENKELISCAVKAAYQYQKRLEYKHILLKNHTPQE